MVKMIVVIIIIILILIYYKNLKAKEKEDVSNEVKREIKIVEAKVVKPRKNFEEKKEIKKEEKIGDKAEKTEIKEDNKKTPSVKEYVYVNIKSKKYHKESCPYAKNSDKLTLEEALKLGCKPCLICNKKEEEMK